MCAHVYAASGGDVVRRSSRAGRSVRGSCASCAVHSEGPHYGDLRHPQLMANRYVNSVAWPCFVVDWTFPFAAQEITRILRCDAVEQTECEIQSVEIQRYVDRGTTQSARARLVERVVESTSNTNITLLQSIYDSRVSFCEGVLERRGTR